MESSEAPQQRALADRELMTRITHMEDMMAEVVKAVERTADFASVQAGRTTRLVKSGDRFDQFIRVYSANEQVKATAAAKREANRLADAEDNRKLIASFGVPVCGLCVGGALYFWQTGIRMNVHSLASASLEVICLLALLLIQIRTFRHPRRSPETAPVEQVPALEEEVGTL